MPLNPLQPLGDEEVCPEIIISMALYPHLCFFPNAYPLLSSVSKDFYGHPWISMDIHTCALVLGWRSRGPRPSHPENLPLCIPSGPHCQVSQRQIHEQARKKAQVERILEKVPSVNQVLNAVVQFVQTIMENHENHQSHQRKSIIACQVVAV